MHKKKKVLIIYAPRKRKEEIIKNINDEAENALIIVTDYSAQSRLAGSCLIRHQ